MSSYAHRLHMRRPWRVRRFMSIGDGMESHYPWWRQKKRPVSPFRGPGFQFFPPRLRSPCPSCYVTMHSNPLPHLEAAYALSSEFHPRSAGSGLRPGLRWLCHFWALPYRRLSERVRHLSRSDRVVCWVLGEWPSPRAGDLVLLRRFELRGGVPK